MCLSRLLSDCGRPEPQPSVIQEAVDLYRRPVADEPGLFDEGFAESVNCLSRRLLNVGRLEQALEAAQESIDDWPLSGLLNVVRVLHAHLSIFLVVSLL